MDFALFVFLNFVLLFHPDHLIPELAGLRLYLWAISLSVLAAAPRLVDAVRPSVLFRRPVTLCVFGFWTAGVLSHVARGYPGLATSSVVEFGKMGVYYLLLTSVLDTPARLRSFLGWLVVIIAGLAGVGLLQFHGVIDSEALRPIEDRKWVDADTGDVVELQQLRSVGLFNDPNDLCLLLVVGTAAGAYRVLSAGSWVVAGLWLAPVAVFQYSLMLTRSRGGLLALVAAVVAYLVARYGWKKAVPLGLAALPVMAVLFAGRQTDLSSASGSGDTANQRMQFWSEGFALLFGGAAGPHTLLLGLGPGEFVEQTRHVAHNSFVHAYVETGLIGGGLFLGAFCAAAWGAFRSPAGVPRYNPPDGLAFLRPFVFALLVGYACGIFSLSRNYIVPTYTVLGIGAVFLAMAVPVPPKWHRIGGGLGWRLALLAVAGLAGLRVFTQAFVRFD